MKNDQNITIDEIRDIYNNNDFWMSPCELSNLYGYMIAEYAFALQELVTDKEKINQLLSENYFLHKPLEIVETDMLDLKISLKTFSLMDQMLSNADEIRKHTETNDIVDRYFKIKPNIEFKYELSFRTDTSASQSISIRNHYLLYHIDKNNIKSLAELDNYKAIVINNPLKVNANYIGFIGFKKK